MTPERFLALLEARLCAIYQAFADGRDVSPAYRYRTEGYLEAALELGFFSEQQCADLQGRLQRDILGKECALGQEQPARVPVIMKRAPVYPSTKEA